MTRLQSKFPTALLVTALLVGGVTHVGRAAEIEVATIEHPDAVDFQKELLPILRKKCLACHNETDAESDLVLESPQTIANGGSSGEAVVAGDPDASLMFQLAAHREDPVMPPEDNASDAPPMTPEELALLALWIKQGAQGSVSAQQVIEWQALPDIVNPIFAATQTQDGRFVAAGRANQVAIYDLMLGRFVDRLVDPNLADSPVAGGGEISHLDLIQALAFDDDGEWLATGGYRTVKLWKRATQVAHETKLASDGALRQAASNGESDYVLKTDGELHVYGDDGQVERELPKAERFTVAEDGTLAIATDATHIQIAKPDGTQVADLTTPAPVTAMMWKDAATLVAGTDSGLILEWKTNENPTEPRQLSGHEAAVTDLSVFQAKLVSGDATGHIHLWNEAGESERSYQHGASITSLAAAGDHLLSAGGEQSAKIWAIDKDEAVGTLTGRPDLAWDVTRKTLSQQVAKRHVDNANSDLEAAKKRVEQEEANLKKTIEARDKAEEERKKSNEANEKAKAELATAETQKAEAEEKQKSAETANSEATEGEAKQQAEKALAEAQETLKKAEEELKAKKEAADKAAEDLKNKTQTVESNKRSVETSEKVVETSKQKVTELGPVLEEVKKTFSASEETLKQAQETLNSHSFQAVLVAGSKSGQLAVAADAAGNTRVFRVSDGSAFAAFESKAPCLFAEFVEEDVLRVITNDGRSATWDLATHWELASTLGSVNGDSPFADRITALAFSPDGTRLAVGGGEPSRTGQLMIVDMEQMKITQEIEDAHSDSVFGVAFSPDGQQIASCGADRFMKVFDLESGDLVRNYEGHTHHVLCVAWRADGRALATGGADKVVKVWNTVDGSQIKTIQGFGKEVAALQFAGSTDDFFTACGDHNVYRCNVGGDRKSIGKGTDFLYAVSTNALGEKVAFAGHDSVLRIVDREGKAIIEFNPAP